MEARNSFEMLVAAKKIARWNIPKENRSDNLS